MTEYIVPYQDAESEFTEKRSRFITHLYKVETEAEARARIEEMKKKYYDARHNCWCYLLQEGGVVRYSDDGEPAKTAGTPALEVLQHSGLTDLIVVVTRYFGGVLLGTGGLVRAYTTATARALENAEVAGYSLYEAATMRFSDGMVFVTLLMLTMLAGKAVCFSALIQPLAKHSLAPWLCLPLLLLTMPKALVQDAAVQPGWTVGYVLCAVALAFGMSDGAVLWKEKRLQEEKG